MPHSPKALDCIDFLLSSCAPLNNGRANSEKLLETVESEQHKADHGENLLFSEGSVRSFWLSPCRRLIEKKLHGSVRRHHFSPGGERKCRSTLSGSRHLRF